jgi:hypothetical protein
MLCFSWKKNFSLDKDYKIFAPESSGAKSGRGGHNKKKITMTITTFKSLCLKACTKKADEIHNYYMKLEELLQELIQEEGNELREQLELKDKLLENHINTAQLQQELLRERV